MPRAWVDELRDAEDRSRVAIALRARAVSLRAAAAERLALQLHAAVPAPRTSRLTVQIFNYRGHGVWEVTTTRGALRVLQEVIRATAEL